MSAIIGIVVVALVLIVASILFIATRPESFRIERSALISSPPTKVFSIVNDFRQWSRWSPFDKRDPNMKTSFDGPTAGPGAIYAWSGNTQVGEGHMTVLDSKPAELVSMKLEFSRPFKATNEVNFKLVPSEGGTRVSWIMDGKRNFVSKAMSVFMDIDKMVGKDFEQGLANLNTVAHAETRTSV